MTHADCASPLVTFAYLSTARMPLDEGQLDALLGGARCFNAQHGLTGLLLYNGGSFMQVLEGPRDAVRVVFEERIRPSPMHGDIVELFSSGIAHRHFPGWSMACKHVPGQPLPAVLSDPRLATRHWAIVDFWTMWEAPLDAAGPNEKARHREMTGFLTG